MTRFSADVASEATVTAERKAVWDVLVDPVLLPKLTPLLSRIEDDGSLWRWHMVRLAVMGVGIKPVFTERMTFDEGVRIDFTHEPPAGVTEWAGAEGHYTLSDTPGGTHLEIGLRLDVDLPLSRLAAPVVERTMRSTMAVTGDRFSANLLKHLKAKQR
ncbi:hypothetical protein [Pseudonocardia endophytica]|uniref:Carbon monoxide dehydrogenase subunit G n=1 Tax=Pseudonocardia endophytica TaxID=401976 RepID=A0A4R1HQ68_PSEEN|nr:hypothetical protein [Pseudonocardia endophytica]TCK24248.1 carbon monoxide dehydrogenase subunit G [Pseudonocardia endophytica]